MSFLQPGIHFITPQRYHADPCERPSLSSGLGKIITAQSPRHAWHASHRLNDRLEPVTKKEFDVGTAAHTLVLGKGNEIAVVPSSICDKNGHATTARAKQFIADARELGKTPLSETDYETVSAMALVLRDAMTEVGLEFEPDRSEITAIAEIDGCLCRAMMDNVPRNARLPILDYKTTAASAHPGKAAHTIDQMEYDHQWAHYTEVWHAATGQHREFVFIFQEKIAPFEVSFCHLLASDGHSEDWAKAAKERTKEARMLWQECYETGKYPGYTRRIVTLGAPAYRQQKWDQRHDLIISARQQREAQRRSDDWQSPQGIQGE